jgi:hypothetical protein
MFALAALALAAQGAPALTRADAAHWPASGRAAPTTATRPAASRMKALAQAVRRLGPDDQPASFAQSGPSGL